MTLISTYVTVHQGSCTLLELYSLSRSAINYSAVVFYANLKQCDIKTLIKSHFMRKIWNNANPPHPPKKNSARITYVFQSCGLGMFTLLPLGGATLDGKQNHAAVVLNYARSSRAHPRIKCDRTVFIKCCYTVKKTFAKCFVWLHIHVPNAPVLKIVLIDCILNISWTLGDLQRRSQSKTLWSHKKK
jgi:hypothetical protein